MHSAWVLHRDRKSPLVLPLASGDKVVTQHVIRTEVCCNGVAAPSLKSAPKPTIAPAATTSVLRVVAYRGFVSPQLWQRALASPRGFVQEWGRLAFPLHKQGSIKDAWQFSKHERAADEIVQGLARVATSSVKDLFKASGSQEFFIEPVGRQESTLTVTVSWHRPGPQETWKQLHARLLGEHPAFGLIRGNREIVLPPGPPRPALGSSQALRHSGRMNLFGSSCWPRLRWEPAVIRRLVRKGKCTWWLRASAGAGADAQQVIVEDNGAPQFFLGPAFDLPGHSERSNQPLRGGAFSFKREAFATIEKPVPAPTRSLRILSATPRHRAGVQRLSPRSPLSPSVCASSRPSLSSTRFRAMAPAFSTPLLRASRLRMRLPGPRMHRSVPSRNLRCC